jgi:3-oxoadipate enol-lactonase
MTMPVSMVRNGHGPALLLLHGIGSSRTAWSRQISRLQDAFTCIAPDLPGYGQSPDPTETGLNAIVDAVASALQEDTAYVVGVSFGALVSLALARSHASRVKSLILSDATLGRARSPQVERDRWLAHRVKLARSLASMSLERAAEIAAPGAPAEVVDEIANHMRRARPAGYLAVANAIAETDALPWLGEIHQPALVVCGEHDSVTGMAVSETLTRNLPRARLQRIAGAGHAPHIEQPDRFAELVREFLGGKR